jgi:hypothetical protein
LLIASLFQLKGRLLTPKGGSPYYEPALNERQIGRLAIQIASLFQLKGRLLTTKGGSPYYEPVFNERQIGRLSLQIASLFQFKGEPPPATSAGQAGRKGDPPFDERVTLC